MTIGIMVAAMKEAFSEVLNSLTEFGFAEEDLQMEILEASQNLVAKFSKTVLLELRETFKNYKETQSKHSYYEKSKVTFQEKSNTLIIEGCPSRSTSFLLFLLSQTKFEMANDLRKTPLKEKVDLIWIFSRNDTECAYCGNAIQAKTKVILQRSADKTEVFCSIVCAENQRGFELESEGVYDKIPLSMMN